MEVSTKKKHSCPNRSINGHKPVGAAINNSDSSKSAYYNNNHMNNYDRKNNYNYNKSWPNSNNKQPVDNSLEILQGSTHKIIKQYEVLTDLIKEFKGKTHGSQSHNLPDNSLQIVIYYEIGKLRDVCHPSCTINKVKGNDYCTRRGVPKRMSYRHNKERVRNS
ncbi:hypothetical protein BH23THE1_BH23THE1_34210 [soil metagenome]